MRFLLIFFLIVTFFLLIGCEQKNYTTSVFVQPEDIVKEKNIISNKENETTTITKEKKDFLENKESFNINNKIENKKFEIPDKIEWPVFFAQQAPFANWDEVHEETCEEASMIMVAKYFKSQPLTEAIMEEELQKILKWEKEQGYKVDVTAEEVVEILKDYFQLEAQLSEEVTVDKIKYELSKGNLIIIPAAGRKLKNPNFKQPGPIYHMLVIKGYNNKEFITNDPGTRKGNSYKYSYNILLNSIHNWNHELAKDGMTEEEIIQGKKLIIIVKKS